MARESCPILPSLARLVAVVLLPCLLGCSQRAAPGSGPCQAPRVPELALRDVTTPTEVDITVTLVARPTDAELPQAYWKSAAIDRSATSPEGERWVNDAEVVSNVWVSFEPAPTLHLGMSRTGRKDGGAIFNAPLSLHLVFDGSRAASECASAGLTARVDVELTLIADRGPLRVDAFRAVERRPTAGH